MLPGMKALLNFHPLFVHFPIALWLSALAFEAASLWRSNDEWHRTAVRLLYLGTFAGLAAVSTGLMAQNSVEPGRDIQAVLFQHKVLMLITTGFAIALCLYVYSLRNKFSSSARKVFLAGLVVLAILLTFGADRGGFLVFHYAQSVNETTTR
jgi:uncharacterized membrane protein